jgi:hypothetical protein
MQGFGPSLWNLFPTPSTLPERTPMHPARSRSAAVVLALTLALGLLAAPAAVGEDFAVPDATVQGPIGDAGIRGFALWDSWYDMAEHGYVDEEYFISGTALHATSDATADYTTRIIVFRPTDPQRFNGSVLLDWVNVTAQFENPVDILEAREHLIREGWGFVHVSAQSAGICCTPLTPKVWDPVRYADLSHPGDSYANSIFSQVAKAVRAPAGVDPMGGLDVQRVIAAGQSQSGTRLRSYIIQEQPRAGVIDGFLVHGDYPANKTFPELSVPVIQLLADSEASTAAPTQTANYRLWEVAGAAHSDLWIGSAQVFGQGPRVAGAPKRPASHARDVDALAGNYGEQAHPMHGTCLVGGASFPTRYAINAALYHLERWVDGGAPAPEAPRYEFSGSSLARDSDGNALGGLRLPPIEVPVARYVSTACALGGITVPFTEPELLARYSTHDAYYTQLLERTRDSVAAGFLLRADAEDLLERACGMRTRWADLSDEPCPGLDPPCEQPGSRGEPADDRRPDGRGPGAAGPCKAA